MSLEEFESINQQFIETKKALIERERILSVMESVDKQLLIERNKLPKLITKKKYELYDVQDLEGTTPKSVFYTLLRSREEQLDKEVQELLDAKMVVEKCEMRIASLEDYLIELEIHLIALADCDETLEELQHAQIKLISQLNVPEAEQVATIAKSLPVLQAKHKEYLEASELGQQALSGVNKIIDILLQGKGFGGTWNRHHSYPRMSDPINEAIDLSFKVQPILDKFQQELRDISSHFWYSPELQIPKRPEDPIFIFARFFGTTFPDSVNQSHIHKWVMHLQQLKKRISVKLEMIENELAFLQTSIEKQENAKQSLMAQLWNQSNFAQGS